jgi:hypothetical protein
VTAERERHPEKQRSQSCSTEEGIDINESEMHSEKTHFSMHKSVEPSSNGTLESERHPEKQYSQNPLTDSGMQIDEMLNVSKTPRSFSKKGANQIQMSLSRATSRETVSKRDEHLKSAFLSMHESAEPDSKVAVKRDFHSRKYIYIVGKALSPTTESKLVKGRHISLTEA